MFAAAVVATSLLWLPLAIIPIIDGMLFVASTGEVLRDLALLWWLGLLPAAGLATAGWVVARGAALSGVAFARAGLAGWCVLLLPFGWVCAWLALRMAWQWVRAVTGVDLLITQEVRAAAVLVLTGTLAWGLWRTGLRAVVTRVALALASRWPVAAVVLTLGIVPIAMKPPSVLSFTTAAAPTGSASTDSPDIFLISLDALAAADADACNPESATMPRLAEFAQHATCFERFYTASNFTTPTTSTMESGLLPWTHFATQPDAKMSHETRGHTMAAVLKAEGWRVHSVTDNLLASPRHRGTFAAYTSSGFVHTTLFSNGLREAMTMFPDTALPRLVATSLALLGAFDIALHGQNSPYESERTYAEVRALLAREGRVAPLFVWAHTLPPHAPFLPPPSTKYRLLPKGELDTWREMLADNIDYPASIQPLVDKHRLRYRESIMAADAALGAFLDELQRLGRLESALIIITSDHGESFEKGYYGHAGPLTHDALIRVPLVIKLSGQTTARKVDMQVSQADLAPTILDLVGAPPLPRAEGRSLRDVLEGRPMAAVPVFAMTMERQSRFKPLDRGRYVVIDGDDKLTLRLDPTAATPAAATLHDLRADPTETHDLAAAQPARVAALQAVLRQRLAAAAAAQAQAQTQAAEHPSGQSRP